MKRGTKLKDEVNHNGWNLVQIRKAAYIYMVYEAFAAGSASVCELGPEVWFRWLDTRTVAIPRRKRVLCRGYLRDIWALKTCSCYESGYDTVAEGVWTTMALTMISSVTNVERGLDWNMWEIKQFAREQEKGGSLEALYPTEYDGSRHLTPAEHISGRSV